MPAKNERLEADPARFIREEIKAFTGTSPLNRMPKTAGQPIFDEPLVQFADGDDPLFTEYKTIIDPIHLTPREALARATGKSPRDLPRHLSIISWILPITPETRFSNRQQNKIPSPLWTMTRSFGEKFNHALRAHLVRLLGEMGYLAAAPALEPYFEELTKENGRYSNWSERHIAYAAGLGTFSLSDGFITEKGIAHRCGSAVTDLKLPPNPRTADGPYSNCLFYINAECRACIDRCPADAITESGHNKIKCREHIQSIKPLLAEEYRFERNGCGLCQTGVPCENRNPVSKVEKPTGGYQDAAT